MIAPAEIEQSRLVGSTGFSAIGDGTRLTAVPVVMLGLTHSPIFVTAVGATAFLPWCVSALFPRMQNRLTDSAGHHLRKVQVCRGIWGVLLGLTVAANVVGPSGLLLGALVIACGDPIVASVVQQYVARLEDQSRIARLSSDLLTAETLALQVLGPVCAAAALYFSDWMPFMIDACAYLVAGLLAPQLSQSLNLKISAPPHNEKLHLRGRRPPWALLLWPFLFNTGTTFALAGLPLLLDANGQKDRYASLVLSSGIGLLVGAAIPRILGGSGVRRIAQMTPLVGPCLAMPVLAHGASAVTAGAFLLGGALTSWATLASRLVRLTHSTVTDLAQLTIRARAAGAVGVPLGALLAAIVVTVWGPGASILAGAGVVTVGTMVTQRHALLGQRHGDGEVV